MIPLIPRYFIFLSSLIFGPSRPAPITISVVAAAVVLAFFLPRSFRRRTVALLGIFGLMLADSVLLVVATVYFMLTREPAGLMERSRGVFELFNHVNFWVNVLGVAAAGCVAIFIVFGKSRVSLSKVFPQTKFLEATTEVKETIARLASSAGIAAPDVCLIDSGVPSAFTVRANRRYLVTVSVGLLESLDECEVEACLAHEIAHLKNNDFAVRFLATLAKVALFARPLSYVLEPAVYRAREFLADSTAARLVGGPDALISAFSKLNDSSNMESALPSSACVCGLKGRRRLLGVFDKHPTLEDRLRILREMNQN